MRRQFALTVLLFVSPTLAQEKKVKDADLGQKATVQVDKSLAGDITRKKDDKSKMGPALQYDQFRLGVELQVASKRHEQIESLKKIMDLSSPEDKDRAGLLFQLGELYWEESKYFFFEANRKDDDLINALRKNDKAGQERAKKEKEELNAKSKEFGDKAVEAYSEIVQKYKDYERTDEVLYFLGSNLMEAGEDRKALTAYKRMVEKYQKSRYIPDAWLAFGEYYFNNSKGKREYLEKALEAYKRAADFPENQVYAFAIYKQGWCYFNLANYPQALDKFKTVVLLGELSPGSVEQGPPKANKGTLIKEARNDYVRAYAQYGSPADAKAEFSKVSSRPDDLFLMLKQLANLYYEDGKDKEAALTYNTLIHDRPLSPEAPGFQGRIVDCVLRAGNKKMTVQQVRRLVKIMTDVEKSGAIKDDKDKQALKDARELSERTLSNLAVTWHNEAKKTRDDETFVLANEVYSDYLVLFADNAKAYDLRFFWAELLNDNLQKFDQAAEQYTAVLLQDIKHLEGTKDASGKLVKGKAGKWMVNAAYNAVLAYDEVVKKAEESGKIKADANADLTKAQKIPPEKQALVDACDRYLKYVPKGEKTVEIAFKAANILYRYNHYDDAVLRFSEIALHHPEYKFENGDRAAEVAANLILDSFNAEGNWAKVHEWARRFYNIKELAVGKFRDDLSKLIEQSSFKLISQLEAKKEFAKAAESYKEFVKEFPKSEIADKALYNASIDYFNAKMLDLAMQTRQTLSQRYPKSEYVPACIYANAEGHEAVGDFEDAATAYESYVRGYEKSLEKSEAKPGKPTKKLVKHAAKGKKGKKDDSKEAAPKKEVTQTYDESKAQVALFNSGVFREGLGQYKAALKDREHYLEVWPTSKDSEAVFLSIADLYEKMNNYGKAMGQLEEYEKKYGRDQNKLLNAEGRIANIFEKKIRRPKEADRIHARLLKEYRELGPKGRSTLDNTALDAVAHADYLKNEDDFRFFATYKIKWGRMPDPTKDFKAGLTEKAKRLKVVQEDYAATVKLKAGDPAVCALYKIGLAYDNMADSVINAPMPRGLPPELQDAIRDQMAEQASPIKEKAAEAFTSVVQKSHELDIHNDCAAKSLKLLRDTYRPDQFPSMPEDVVDLKNSKWVASSGDILTSIQPIPVAVAIVPRPIEAKADPVPVAPAPVNDNPDLDKMKDSSPSPTAAETDSKPVAAKPAETKKAPDTEPEDDLK